MKWEGLKLYMEVIRVHNVDLINKSKPEIPRQVASQGKAPSSFSPLLRSAWFQMNGKHAKHGTGA